MGGLLSFGGLRMTAKNLIIPPGKNPGGPPVYDPAERFLTDSEVEEKWDRCSRSPGGDSRRRQ
jgi:hypothetical protein